LPLFSLSSCFVENNIGLPLQYDSFDHSNANYREKVNITYADNTASVGHGESKDLPDYGSTQAVTSGIMDNIPAEYAHQKSENIDQSIVADHLSYDDTYNSPKANRAISKFNSELNSVDVSLVRSTQPERDRTSVDDSRGEKEVCKACVPVCCRRRTYKVNEVVYAFFCFFFFFLAK
jgi:hypothetical protein